MFSNLLKDKRLFGLVVILLALIVVGLIACGPAATPDEPEEPEEPVEPDEPEEPEEPEEPIRIVVAQADDVKSWDPPQDWVTAANWVTMNAYDSLLFPDAESGEFIPELATSWERIDELTMRFHLREGVKFHNGVEFTADAVKYNIERVQQGTREEFIVHNEWLWIDEVRVIDDYTVDIITEEPDTLVLHKLASAVMGYVEPGHAEAVGLEGLHREPMGTGPFFFVEWVRDEHVLLEANPDHYDAPGIDEIMYRSIPEASTRVAELLTGGVHVVHVIPPADWDRVEAASGVAAVERPTGTAYLLIPRMAVHPDYGGIPELDREFTTEDLRIREAIELAIDKHAIISLVGDIGQPIRHRLFPPVPEANPDLYGQAANLYDPERARELIGEAGYAPGEAQIVFHARGVFPQEDIARTITDMLEDVGFDVDLILMDPSSFASDVYHPRKTQELILLPLGGGYNPRWGVFGYQMALADQYGLPAREETDELINICFTETMDNDRRIQAYHEIARIVAEERWNIGLFHEFTKWGVDERLDWLPRVDMAIRGRDMGWLGD